MKNILILEDDEVYREYLKVNLEQFGRVFSFERLEQAESILRKSRIDLAVVDLDLDYPLQGLEFLKNYSEVKTIILSSHEEEEVIGDALRLGANRFLNKWDFEQYLQQEFNEIFCNEELKKFSYENSLNDLMNKKLSQFKKGDIPLLITGETGVGKGHYIKKGFEGEPVLHVNLSEYSEGTLESELFGHERGSFTGAEKKRIGVFEKADGKILFLDEIGTISTSLQKKLLRVLEEKCFYRVGGEEKVSTNFKLITATCDNLPELMTKNEFRNDLYHRLSGIELDIPPLRYRKDDVKKYIEMTLSSRVKRVYIESEAKERLVNYSWDGNFRELKNKLEMILAESNGYITSEELQKYLPPKELPENPSDFLDKVASVGLPDAIKEIESKAYKWAEKECSGKINEMAKVLKISKSLLYRIKNQSVTPVKA